MCCFTDRTSQLAFKASLDDTDMTATKDVQYYFVYSGPAAILAMMMMIIMLMILPNFTQIAVRRHQTETISVCCCQ